MATRTHEAAKPLVGKVALVAGATRGAGTRPDWGKVKIDASRLPPGLLEYIRVGNALQLSWLEIVAERSREFRQQLPKKARAWARRSRTGPWPRRAPMR
jgi:hypothetical protein